MAKLQKQGNTSCKIQPTESFKKHVCKNFDFQRIEPLQTLCFRGHHQPKPQETSCGFLELDRSRANVEMSRSFWIGVLRIAKTKQGFPYSPYSSSLSICDNLLCLTTAMVMSIRCQNFPLTRGVANAMVSDWSATQGLLLQKSNRIDCIKRETSSLLWGHCCFHLLPKLHADAQIDEHMDWTVQSKVSDFPQTFHRWSEGLIAFYARSLCQWGSLNLSGRLERFQRSSTWNSWGTRSSKGRGQRWTMRQCGCEFVHVKS